MPVIIDHDTHVYTNTDNGDIYTSVTTFIGSYKKPFDKDKWSKVVAKREGKTQDEILNKWSEITVTAQNRGTNVHLVMENYVKFNKIEKGYEELVDSFIKKTNGVILPNSNILSEELLYSHDFKLAGMADLIVENDNTFYVLDFKTNKKFNFVSKYNDYFYEPIDYLPQCEFTTYTIQLSIYAWMHEQLTGKKCGGVKIFYLRDFSGKVFWQEIPAPYMKATVVDMLNDKKTKDTNKDS
jgi:ATP-dependent exoDNAse (exonuclease V) beta subunit